ncbi:MAG: hypothetical protein GY694_18155, partial [Gammaproteobacteria bacterium]|nr:hypothetical protein [Gammaproteobacteria bacterium]
MKLVKFSLPLALALITFSLVACTNKQVAEQAPEKEVSQPAEETVATAPEVIPEPAQLPVRFQTPGYITSQEEAQDSLTDEDDHQVKVGATIRSTAGPQPLWDIISRLASLKAMSVSWASDVNRDHLVDVNISPDDNFSDALDNLLRQLDYFHEIKNNTIIIKYRESRIFRLALPYMKGTYNSTVGGDFLPQGDTGNTTQTQGTAQITSPDNEFDVWRDIRTNLDYILDKEYAKATQLADSTPQSQEATAQADTDTESSQRSTQRRSDEKPYYFIDQAAGLITITASRSLLNKFEAYFDTLRTELYRQVVIEAKIVEVYLQDNSKIGLDWTNVLKDFEISGTTFFGGSPSDSEDGTV